MPKKDIYNNLTSNMGLENFKKTEKKISKVRNTIQVALTSVICMTSITSIVFAKDISNKICDNYFGTGNGVGVAIENGYIEEPHTEDANSDSWVENEITGKKVDGVDTKIKVDEFVMDDFTLSITFDVTLSNKIEDAISISKVADMNFPDLLIYDENNIVLFQNMGGSLKQFCDEKNLNISEYTLESDKLINSGVNAYVKERNGNHIKVLYNIYTGEDSYPKSKKINIYMSQIRISPNVESMLGEEEILLQGKWDFSVDVPEKMYNRKRVIYKQVKTTNQDFKVTKAALYDTGMDINLRFPAKKVEMDNWSTPELKFYKSLPEDDKLKSTDILNYLDNQVYNTNEYIEKVQEATNAFEFDKYITNEAGEKFELTVGPRENGSSYINDENIMEFEGMFDVTKYNASDELIVHVDYHGNKADITLKKVEE